MMSGNRFLRSGRNGFYQSGSYTEFEFGRTSGRHDVAYPAEQFGIGDEYGYVVLKEEFVAFMKLLSRRYSLKAQGGRNAGEQAETGVDERGLIALAEPDIGAGSQRIE